MGRIWAVCSGCGGVGKTTLAVSLACGAARRGKHTILLDTAGLSRSCDLRLKMESVIAIDMTDVITQRADIRSALYPAPEHPNLQLAVASLSESVPFSELSGIILALQSMCDVLVLDLPTGQAPTDAGLLAAEDTCLFVAKPDDVSIRATERLMLKSRSCEADAALVLNYVRRDMVKKELQYSNEAVSYTLDCSILGAIPYDDGFASTASRGKNAFDFGFAASGAIRSILDQLLNGRNC